jgi:hypothetical protein
MTLSLAGLQGMPDEELVRTYDQMAMGTPPTLAMFRDELNRRAYERDAEAMHQLTQQTVRLTEQTVRLTRVNTVVAILAIIVGVVVPLLSEQALRPPPVCSGEGLKVRGAGCLPAAREKVKRAAATFAPLKPVEERHQRSQTLG